MDERPIEPVRQPGAEQLPPPVPGLLGIDYPDSAGRDGRPRFGAGRTEQGVHHRALARSGDSRDHHDRPGRITQAGHRHGTTQVRLAVRPQLDFGERRHRSRDSHEE
ncbi:hypothetical protein [Fodinicola feengrottensis]|uniref:hypothetical protein n=1 Tax=Fodinicola feengrottensis TaxID=435914 RepID=UPI0013D0D7D3|nr:hypothetical protein [Fodinicola feengrottensis]